MHNAAYVHCEKIMKYFSGSKPGNFLNKGSQKGSKF